MKKFLYPGMLAGLLAVSGSIYAQNSFRAIVKDKQTGTALTGVIATDKHGHGAASDDSGMVLITGFDGARATIYFTYLGYDDDSIVISFPDSTLHTVLLNPGGE